MPHQQHVWDVALEVDDDGRFVYDTIDLTIMRQSGKTSLTFDKNVWRLTVAPGLARPDGKKWGRQRCLFTAQRRQDARKKLEQDFREMLRDDVARRSFREIQNPKARPVKAHEWKLSLNNGAEHMLFGRGNYLLIEAPVADAGHSDSIDDVTLDEIWAYRDDAVEQGVGPTMATRWNAQMWRTSTAGDQNSYYMWPLIKSGRASSCTCGAKILDECDCGYQPGSRIAYFEYSLPDGCDIEDEALWWDHMPALGRTISVEFLRSQLEKARQRPEEGGEDLWRRGYGNIWTAIPLIGGETRVAKLPPEAWADSVVDFEDTPPMNPGEIAIGFDVAPGGQWSSIAVAVGPLSRPYVELIEHRPETGWLPGRLAELAVRWRPLAIGFDQAGPAGALADIVRTELRAAGADADRLQPLTSQQYRAACGAFHLDVVEGRLRRARMQPPLDDAGADATDRRVGDGWLWDRRMETTIAPLVAATVARSLVAGGEQPLEPWFGWSN